LVLLAAPAELGRAAERRRKNFGGTAKATRRWNAVCYTASADVRHRQHAPGTVAFGSAWLACGSGRASDNRRTHHLSPAGQRLAIRGGCVLPE